MAEITAGRAPENRPALENTPLHIREKLLAPLADESMGGAELKALKSLLQAQTGVSAGAINAHHAVMTARAREILSRAGLDRSLSERQFFFACEYMRLSADRADALCELVSGLKVPQENLAAAVREFEEWLKTDEKKGVAPPAPLTARGAAPRHAPSVTGTSEPAAAIKGGEFTDYKFREKVLWREAWTAFLLKHFESLSASERQALKVLCLPSRECQHELSIYLDILKIPPANIYAVEGGGQAARAEFLRNLRAMGDRAAGVHAICARLEEFLPGCGQKFGLVNYDFHGPVCDSNLSDIQMTPIADRAFIIMNFLAAREQRPYQNVMKRQLAWVKDPGMIFRAADMAAEPEETQKAVFERDCGNAGEEDLAEARDSMLDYLMLNNLAVLHLQDGNPYRFGMRRLVENINRATRKCAEGGRYVNRPDDPLMRDTFQNVMYLFTRDFLARYNEFYTTIPFNLNLFGRNFMRLGFDCCFRVNKVYDLEKVRYLSGASDTHSPFNSFFAAVLHPLAEYKRWQRTAAFILRVVNRAVENDSAIHPRAQELLVADGDYPLPFLHAENPLRERHRLCLVEDGRINNDCSIPIGALNAEVMDYARWIEQFPLDIPANANTVKRRVLK